ncbi:hypothetical protein BDV19DRAFT_390985 [Aspergillus venezuelensis]
MAIETARDTLGDMGVRVPDVYFAGVKPRIKNQQVLIQERLPGVVLSVARPYISTAHRDSFKEQAREILRCLYAIKPSDKSQAENQLVPDQNILSNGRIPDIEREILFNPHCSISPGTNNEEVSGARLGTGLAHNDLTPSNIVASNDKTTGLIDWEMAGFFPWNTAAEIHRRIRTPQREQFAAAGLSEEVLEDMLFWTDLYDF